MNKKRLLKLADFLDELPRKLFDFGTVAYAEKGLTPKQALKAGPKCGTVGCAMGWAPVVFPRLLKYVKETDIDPTDQFADPTQIFIELRDKSAILDEWTQHDYSTIASEIFDIPNDDANALFTPDYTSFNSVPALETGLSDKATPKQVAKRIRRYVKETEKALEREALDQESEQFATV